MNDKMNKWTDERTFVIVELLLRLKGSDGGGEDDDESGDEGGDEGGYDGGGECGGGL